MYLASGQPNILNYLSQAVTYPYFREYSNILITRATAYDTTITVSATKSAFKEVSVGDYLFLDTGDKTSQIVKIVGINRSEFKIITDLPITVTPSDLVLRTCKTIPYNEFCLYNNGYTDVYLNGQAVSSGDIVHWKDMEGKPPVVIYGQGVFQISNGKIIAPASASSGGTARRFHPATVVSGGAGVGYIQDGRLIEGLSDEQIEVDYNNQNWALGLHYTLDLANNKIEPIAPTTISASAKIYITIFRPPTTGTGFSEWVMKHVSSAYTANIWEFVIADATSGNIVISLPAANLYDGKQIQGYKSDASGNTVTVDGNVLASQGDIVLLTADAATNTWIPS